MNKLLTFINLNLLVCIFVFAEENQKPFIKEHREDEHKINFVNATVYQQIGGFGAIYNTSHLFFEYDINDSQLFFINTSITLGDGITKQLDNKGYTIYTTGDDLETYLKNINDTGRKYILEAYYQINFGRLVFIGGLIDSTAFIDTNNYANDEHIQFLNFAFINNPIAVLPSYNLGVYAKYKITEENSISAVFMDNSPENENIFIGEFEKEEDFYNLRFFGFQTTKTNQNGLGISADYTFQNNLGMFFRFGYTNTDYNFFYSIGLVKEKFITDIASFGIAYGFVNGKNSLKDIYVSEIYYEITPNKHIAFTLDLQYMKELNEDFIFGTRFYLSY